MDNRISGYGKSQLETPAAQWENASVADEMDYQQSVRIIGEELQKTKQSFIKIGWYLKHIKDKELYGRDGYSSIYEFAKDKFHISQSTATRFMNLCMEFSVGSDSAELDRKYENFTVSLSWYNKVVTPNGKYMIYSNQCKGRCYTCQKQKSMNQNLKRKSYSSI